MNHLGGCKLQARDAREGKASAVFRSFGPLQHGHLGRHWPAQTSINTSCTLPHSHLRLHAISIGNII